jgi:hypothetical protein
VVESAVDQSLDLKGLGLVDKSYLIAAGIQRQVWIMIGGNGRNSANVTDLWACVFSHVWVPDSPPALPSSSWLKSLRSTKQRAALETEY